jgi:HAD superfamily hydrolase (TIGR01549 family)
MAGRRPFDAVLLDVDGTLVDTNYQHALAWYRAFRAHGDVLPLWAIHRHIGMGGDLLVPALIGDEGERDRGDALRDAWEKEFATLIDEVAPLPGARDLLRRLAESPARVCLASSGKADQVEHYLDLLDARDLVDAWTTSDDVDTTKPEPDVLRVANERIGGQHAVTVGDSSWDFEAARRLGVAGLAVLTGGFSEAELRDAGAQDVYDGLPALTDALLVRLGC